MTGLTEIAQNETDPMAERLKVAIDSPVMTAYDGDTLKRARRWARLTQEELGDRVGSPRSVSRWETDGISTRSPYFEAVQRELRLDDPLVLRSIQAVDDAEPDQQAIVNIDPPALSDGALVSLIDSLMAEWKRRFWARSPAGVVRLHGQTAPYPHHVDENPARGRARSGE